MLVIPWAIPGFLSLLVWQGLLNDDFGVVNQAPRALACAVAVRRQRLLLAAVHQLAAHRRHLRQRLADDALFLPRLDGLPAVDPEELTEAARVDGGRACQVFRRVTLPLALVAVAPLMIASFAFNFNNFNNVLPADSAAGRTTGASPIAGNTDILISYTYKLAIASGTGSATMRWQARCDHHLLRRGVDLGCLVPADLSLENDEMSTTERTRRPPPSRRRRRWPVKRPSRRPPFRDTWWRHLVGIIALFVGSLPGAVYIVSSAFNAKTPRSATVIPSDFTTKHFRNLLTTRGRGHRREARPALPELVPELHADRRYDRAPTTVPGALAAYAFSRFRFRGRPVGMLFLLLIQIFPAVRARSRRST